MKLRNPSEVGFKPLFNGNDFSARDFPSGNEAGWSVQNGVSAGTATTGPSAIASKRTDSKQSPASLLSLDEVAYRSSRFRNKLPRLAVERAIRIALRRRVASL